MPTVIVPETAAMKPAFHAPNEALHPGQINYQDFSNNAALKAASDGLGYLFEGQRSLNELRMNANPEHSPARHARVVAEAVNSFGENAAGVLESAKAVLKSEQRRLDSELEAAANLKPVAHHFAAIVGTFSNMKASQRARALDDLIDQQDGPTLAALVETSIVLTGLTPEQRASIKLRLYAKANSVGLALSHQLTKALAKCEAASIANINGQMQLREGTDRFNEKTRHAEAIAQRAGFNA